MKRILPLLVAVFTINLVTAQQKAPLKNYKIEVAPKSNSVVNNSSSSSSQPAPLWSDDCSDPTTWSFTNTSLPPLDWNWTNNTDIQSQCVTNLPASLQTFNSTTASNGFMIINSDAAPGNVDQNGTPIVCEFTNVQPIDLTDMQMFS